MRIFKFGGASVKDAASVRNVCTVLKTVGYENTGVVISAMGKTTNALELLVSAHVNDENVSPYLDQLLESHLHIVNELLDESSSDNDDVVVRFRESGIIHTVEELISDLSDNLSQLARTDYSMVYDQVVCYGELLSTKIVAAYLNACDVSLQWKDAREFIKTDATYRNATVDWTKTASQVEKNLTDNFITQGFIADSDNGKTTTLGREGSDYSAAIIAYCLKADSVTIWKDVPGVLSGDPREFKDMILLNSISYSEAIELAFYGASVIHPKTLQPLKKSGIPLLVKSFLNPTAAGTTITDGQALEPHTPCFILKKNMIFITVASKDFNFIGEHNISDIFHELNKYQMQVGLLQNSAISFTMCVEDKYHKIAALINALKERYSIETTSGVSLFTIRHYTGDAVDEVEQSGKILLKQRTAETLQLVISPNPA